MNIYRIQTVAKDRRICDHHLDDDSSGVPKRDSGGHDSAHNECSTKCHCLFIVSLLRFETQPNRCRRCESLASFFIQPNSNFLPNLMRLLQGYNRSHSKSSKNVSLTNVIFSHQNLGEGFIALASCSKSSVTQKFNHCGK